MSNPTRHALVIGAGIFGASAALELARRGWGVTLVDRFGGEPPAPHARASSTDVSKVIRMDYGADRYYAELAGEAMARWDEWNDRFQRPLFHRAGFLLLSERPLGLGSVDDDATATGQPPSFEAESYRLLREMGQPVERVNPSVLRGRFPAWNADVYPEGYLNPKAGWAESGQVVAEVMGWCRDAGVHFLDGEVRTLTSTGSGPRVALDTRAGSENRTPDLVVVAAGAWTPGLLPGVGSAIEPRAMPVVHIRPRKPELFRPERFPVWGADISRTGWYGFPLHPDGYVKIGHHGLGWSDDPDSAEALPASFEPRLRDFLARSLPGLADGEIVHRRVCFYADARDGYFWIDRVPGYPGVVVASGGSGHGFKFGPVLGELVANAAEGVRDLRLEPLRWRPGAGPAREGARATTSVDERAR